MIYIKTVSSYPNGLNIPSLWLLDHPSLLDEMEIELSNSLNKLFKDSGIKEDSDNLIENCRATARCFYREKEVTSNERIEPKDIKEFIQEIIELTTKIKI